MSIGVIFIGIFFTMMTRKKHYEISNQVRQRVNTVSDKTLRLTDDPYRNLKKTQAYINGDTDPGTTRSRLRSLGGAVLRAVVFIVEISVVHGISV